MPFKPLRGLTDIKGLHSEYRRFPLERLRADLIELGRTGAQAFTFADEDLLGSNSSEAEHFVTALEQMKDEGVLSFPFDASLRVQSLYSNDWTTDQHRSAKALLVRLKKAGLRKAFLGIESGSESQLARYSKGYVPEEAARAAFLVREVGITLEIGYIMFDPLCTIEEVEQDIRFLQENSLAEVTSSLGSSLELRVQLGSRYLSMLKLVESQTGEKLYGDDVDPNTLTVASTYRDPRVRLMIEVLREWNKRMRVLYYPLKSLSRYGTGGALAGLAEPVRELVSQVRHAYLERILEAITLIRDSGNTDLVNQTPFEADLRLFSERTLSIFGYAPDGLSGHPIVSALLKAAKEQLA